MSQRLPGLLSAVQAVLAVRWRPRGKDGERLSAGATASAANPDTSVPLIVRLFEPPAVTDDGTVAARRTPTRQQSQREDGHPGSIWFSFSGSAIKRIKAGVKPRPERPAKAPSGCGTSPSGKSDRTKKRLQLFEPLMRPCGSAAEARPSGWRRRPLKCCRGELKKRTPQEKKRLILAKGLPQCLR